MATKKKKIVAGVLGTASVAKSTVNKAMAKLAEDHTIVKVIIPGSKALCTDTIQNVQAWCVANDVEYEVVTPTEEKGTRGNYALVRKGAVKVHFNKNVGAKVGALVAADENNILVILPVDDDGDSDNEDLEAGALKAHEAGCALWNMRKKPIAIEEIENGDSDDDDSDDDDDDDDDDEDEKPSKSKSKSKKSKDDDDDDDDDGQADIVTEVAEALIAAGKGLKKLASALAE